MSAIFKDFNNNSKYIQKELDLSELTWMDTSSYKKIKLQLAQKSKEALTASLRAKQQMDLFE
jgi:hypothetical protein